MKNHPANNDIQAVHDNAIAQEEKRLGRKLSAIEAARVFAETLPAIGDLIRLHTADSTPKFLN